MSRAFPIMLVLCLASAAFAEEGTKGAKAIFIDSTSTTIVVTESATPAKRRNKPTTRKPTPPAVARSAATEVSGLMYYVELVSANGETSRVTTDRVFRSGERILLHVTSSIDGDIAVLQRMPDGQLTTLFPDARIRNGSAYISKNVDTILPASTAWFRFDNEPGTEELILRLTPRVATAPPEQSRVTHATPIRTDDITSAAGSKGLLVETENTGAQQATYVVRRTEAGQVPEPIVVRILLEHR